ncbi:2-oxo acid dehydrogenase subunit E2 [Actinomadura sp. ATCC 31491]|uniref:Dihydrolipoamide acetyltransferase component of pyruvate dehydrogenase complex n=1 Tax=Actinomadura luzonensis TaxID=2805427 RepID=A0ABT0G2G3_9ACTN|nr:2-oxo acid dehydrogenase subunit E2 [Actinomadura luzonensis]MCK2218308.1 2-oxo acid dehydrogenase subunit E2 [Actinomadura luzonensis]
MAEFLMPSLGADMETGTVTEWLVKPGDTIVRGEPIAVIDTDKATIEVESFHTGVVERLLVGLDERVPVGTPLAVISEKVAPAARHRAPAPPAQAPPAGAAPVPGPSPEHVPAMTPLIRRLAAERGLDPAAVHGTGPGGRVTRADLERATAGEPAGKPAAPSAAPQTRIQKTRIQKTRAQVPAPARIKASPLARRLAAELGVDLRTVTATGRTGAIRADDVRRTAAAPPAPTAAARARPRPGMRQAIARAMSRSKREIPHYYLTATTDLSAALTWLRERNRQLPVPRRILPAALLLKAAARAVAEVPQLNGFWRDDAFVPGEAVHLGVAISLRDGGLIAPALHDAANRDLADLMAAMKDLVGRARTGRLRGSEMTEATITVTNLGDQGVESVHGVIYPPQVALVGFGRISERPWAVGGLLGVRPLVTVTLAADHRASDGYTGGRFLTAVDRLLNHPEEL